MAVKEKDVVDTTFATDTRTTSVQSTVASATETALREEVTVLRGQIEALEGRLSLLESMPTQTTSTTAPRFTTDSVPASVTNAPIADLQSMVGHPPTADQISRWQQIQESRANQKTASRQSQPNQESAARLNQILRELEGENLGSARKRLDNLKVKGTITGYMILPPGSAYPQDSRTGRLLVTVDQYQVIIRAELG